ncbi:hypothetical protein Micbo1qcDRAFT_216395 [Microdochium bolleyi]|uniref:Uncharacterized protein n=1 Tax=Microdochium bolleyi TaxID=196109 RepID=A0A136IQW6_9PEZI|nr:hypothetical protein Micbo1qcDRAFT_216395 [Microdochium bolleyi]
MSPHRPASTLTQQGRPVAPRATTEPPTTKLYPRSNLGPLTAQSVPSEQHSSCRYAFQTCEKCVLGGGWEAQRCSRDITLDNTACWPETKGGVTVPTHALSGWGMYSPGIVCPWGFTSAAEATYGRGGFPFQYPLTSDEMAVACCPTPGSLGGGDFVPIQGLDRVQTCRMLARSGAVVTMASCSASDQISLTTLTLPYTPPAFYPISVIEIWVPLIQVVWRSSDVPPGMTAPNGEHALQTTLPGNASGTTDSGPASSNTSSADGSDNMGNAGGLPTGAQVGIGISVGIVGLTLILAAWYLCAVWYRRRAAQTTTGPSSHSEIEELDTSPRTDYRDDVAEVEATGIAQLDDDHGHGAGRHDWHKGHMASDARNRPGPPAELAGQQVS